MEDLETRDKLSVLADLGFLRPTFFNPNHWAAIIQIGSFVFIVDGNHAALMVGYQNRWQYPNLVDAARALHEWSGEGQPREWIGAQRSNEMTVWP